MRRRKQERTSRGRDTFQPTLYLKLAGLLIAIGYSIAFVIENNRQISVHFVVAHTRVSLIWEILLLLAVGVVGGVLLSQLYGHRRSQKRAEPADAVPDLSGGDEAVREPGGAPPT
jgi:hypothetical protein